MIKELKSLSLSLNTSSVKEYVYIIHKYDEILKNT